MSTITPVFNFQEDLLKARNINDLKERLLFLLKRYYASFSNSYSISKDDERFKYYEEQRNNEQYRKVIGTEIRRLEETTFNFNEVLLESSKIENVNSRLAYLEAQRIDFCRLYTLAGKPNDVFYKTFYIGVWREVQHTQGIINSHAQQNPSSQKLSFHWMGSPEELRLLYERMIGANLIANDTTEDNFNLLFQGKAINDIKPVRWLNRPVLLAYFVLKLRDKVSFSDNYWQIAEATIEYYSNKRKAYIKPNKLQAHLTDNSLPKDHQIIDDVFLPKTAD